jgi:hypothetical protein
MKFRLERKQRVTKMTVSETNVININSSVGTRELKTVQLSATRRSYFAILWVSLVSFAAINFCVASQLVFIVVSVYFVIDSVQKLLEIPSYVTATKTSTLRHLYWEEFELANLAFIMSFRHRECPDLPPSLIIKTIMVTIQVMWLSVTTAWLVLGLRMEETSSRYGG